MSKKYLDWWLESPANFTGVTLKDRTRNYATIVYPDNKGDPERGLSLTSPDWIDILRSFNVPCFISPLHDKDTDPDENHEKKPHYHVLIMFDGVKTIRQFDKIRDSIGGVGFYPVESAAGYARYLCHLDNANKHQYPISDVICIGGADYEITIGATYNRKACIIQMLRFIDRHNVMTFSQILRYSLKYEPDWFNCLLDNSFLIREYVKGYMLEKQNSYNEIKKD